MRGRPGVRPRYGRVASAVGALGVTAVALLGAGGLIPLGAGAGSPEPLTTGAAPAVPATDRTSAGPAPQGIASSVPDGPARLQSDGTEHAGKPAVEDATPPARDPEALPARSGGGRRVVFDISEQRVWLVDRGNRVRRTYLVSGSLTDNLEPGSYQVYSTSRHAVGIDDSGTMQYMVRFAHGKRAAIGFHDIPVHGGEPVQTRAQLGTPQSHGCVRQWRPDARALWYFATVGTKVVVTA